MTREKPRPGQESVWDYPRPPRLEPSTRAVRVALAGVTVAESAHAFRVLETSHPPSWYIPRADVHMELLTPAGKGSVCEWKGAARYWTVTAGGRVALDAAWSYESPNPSFALIQRHFAFYPALVECYVDQERVQPQPGSFYGGWITSDLAGPFKGAPGTSGW